MSLRTLGAAALAATLAQAANVNVHNNCNFYVKATPSQEGTDNSPQYIEPGDKFTAPVNQNAMCLKLYASKGNGWASNPTQLEWSTWTSGGNDVLSYDLSNIDMGDDTTFLQHGMNLTSSDPACDAEDSTCRPAICTAQGFVSEMQPCEDAYNQPYDTRTLGASAAYDIDMHLCLHDDSSDDDSGSAAAESSTLETVAASTPAPTSVDEGALPAQADATGGPVSEGEVVTEYETQTITARGAEATLERAIEKRIAHMHHARHLSHE